MGLWAQAGHTCTASHNQIRSATTLFAENGCNVMCSANQKVSNIDRKTTQFWFGFGPTALILVCASCHQKPTSDRSVGGPMHPHFLTFWTHAWRGSQQVIRCRPNKMNFPSFFMLTTCMQCDILFVDVPTWLKHDWLNKKTTKSGAMLERTKKCCQLSNLLEDPKRIMFNWGCLVPPRAETPWCRNHGKDGPARPSNPSQSTHRLSHFFRTTEVRELNDSSA